MTDNNNDTIFTCPVICWILAAGAGLITLIILASGLGLGAFWALLFGIAVFVAVGWFLPGRFCEGADASGSQTIAATRQSVASVDSVGQSDLATTPAAPKPGHKPQAAAAKKTAAKKSGTAKKTTKPAAKKPAAKPVVKKAPAKTAAKKTTTAKTAAKPAAKKVAAKPAAKKVTAKPARKPVAKDGKPEMLKKARAGGADDLKQISGVGAKLEKSLNDMGVYHFDQVAGWRVAEVKWADENLVGFKGRVSRDDWVKQAKILARGGTTEFSKKVKKGDVYKN